MSMTYRQIDELLEYRGTNPGGAWGDGWPEERPEGVHQEAWAFMVGRRRSDIRDERERQKNRRREERLAEQERAYEKAAEEYLNGVEEEIRRKHVPEWFLNGESPPSEVAELRAELDQEKAAAEIAGLYAHERKDTQIYRIAQNRMEQLRNGKSPPGTLPLLED